MGVYTADVRREDEGDAMKLYAVTMTVHALVAAESAEAAVAYASGYRRDEIVHDGDVSVVAVPCNLIPTPWVGALAFADLPMGDPRRQWTCARWMAETRGR